MAPVGNLWPLVGLAERIAQLTASNDRLHRLIQARVVQFENPQEQQLLERINRQLHVTGFQKKLLDLVREVERERKPVIHFGRNEGGG